MTTAYFVTAGLLFAWCYRRTRRTARAIRDNRLGFDGLAE